MSDQTIKPGQQLHEQWTVEFTRMRADSPIVGRLISWPHHTQYATRGEGDTIEAARLAMVTQIAKAIHEDPNPFGDLGKVAHISEVVNLLEAMKQEDNDYYLPANVGGMPANDWEVVIDGVINVIKSWSDYYPEEDVDVSDPDSVDVIPPA